MDKTADNPDEAAGMSISIRLNPSARRVIEAVRRDTGVPQTEAMIRILEWFAGLDRKLRLAILTRDVDTREELTRLAVMEMAGIEPGSRDAIIATASVTTEDALKVIQLMAAKAAKNEEARRRHEQPQAGGEKPDRKGKGQPK